MLKMLKWTHYPLPGNLTTRRPDVLSSCGFSASWILLLPC